MRFRVSRRCALARCFAAHDPTIVSVAIETVKIRLPAVQRPHAMAATPPVCSIGLADRAISTGSVASPWVVEDGEPTLESEVVTVQTIRVA